MTGTRAASLLFATLAILAPPAVHAAEKKGPAWPANVHLIEARLGAAAFQGLSFALPRLRLYDAQGWRLASLTGYDARELRRILTDGLRGRGTPDGALLDEDLAAVESAAGERLTARPPADYTVVEYWADWCHPCHLQTADLVQILGKYPKLSINVVYVDAGGPPKPAP